MTDRKTVYINVEIEGNHNFDLINKGKTGEVLKQVNAFIIQLFLPINKFKFFCKKRRLKIDGFFSDNF
jgi:hypothetical protein